MCSHYENIRDPQRLFQAFGTAAPHSMGKVDVWPQYEGLFIRVPPHRDTGDEAIPEREALPGRFGLIPHWATDLKLGRNTFNARSETAATKPSFRDAWKWARHCIVPAESIFEPDWRSGKAIATRIKRSDGQPMGLAGLFAWWKDDKGAEIHSFTLLTINATDHALMNQFHKPADEKRMVVILPEESYGPWLNAKPEDSMDFMRPYPADGLMAEVPAAA
jgi:putative SOS response-associated peptidase YedK